MVKEKIKNMTIMERCTVSIIPLVISSMLISIVSFVRLEQKFESHCESTNKLYEIGCPPARALISEVVALQVEVKTLNRILGAAPLPSSMSIGPVAERR
jgi:hypothetical protein